MELLHDPEPDVETFAAFVDRIEPGLRRSLVATYGPVDGREATVEALSWAWEHWDRLSAINNESAYLYRVGQSSVRRFAATAVAPKFPQAITDELRDIEPGLLPALESLSPQQRAVVLLVHAHGWSQAEVGRMLGINPSTVREHLNRAMTRLRDQLEVNDAN